MERRYTGLEFIEGFSLLAGALWLGGALLFGGLAIVGNGGVGPAQIEADVAGPTDTAATAEGGDAAPAQ